MKLKNEQEYLDWKAKNNDSYGRAIFGYAEAWADLMEQEIKQGKEVKDIAEAASDEADICGITGFMHGMAVSILSQCWIYGEELRKWHNGEYNCTGEGTVNPAIMTIG